MCLILFTAIAFFFIDGGAIGDHASLGFGFSTQH
jgi:hypothetical protein